MSLYRWYNGVQYRWYYGIQYPWYNGVQYRWYNSVHACTIFSIRTMVQCRYIDDTTVYNIDDTMVYSIHDTIVYNIDDTIVYMHVQYSRYVQWYNIVISMIQRCTISLIQRCRYQYERCIVRMYRWYLMIRYHEVTVKVTGRLYRLWPCCPIQISHIKSTFFGCDFIGIKLWIKYKNAYAGPHTAVAPSGHRRNLRFSSMQSSWPLPLW